MSVVWRASLGVALTVGLALPVITEGASPQPVYFWGNVAAIVKAPRRPSLPEVVRPSTIILFADGSWDIDHLQWSSWGSSAAHATGISSASNGVPNLAEGKRSAVPARITLSQPGRFAGRRVYRCFRLTVPSYPASDQYSCLRGHAGSYFFSAA